jgi:hypothetical protein
MGKSWYPLFSFVTCCALPEPAPVACGLSPHRPRKVAYGADLEALIEARVARASALRPIVKDLRARQANLQRPARREAHVKLAADIPVPAFNSGPSAALLMWGRHGRQASAIETKLRPGELHDI